MKDIFKPLTIGIGKVPVCTHVGRICGIENGTVIARGLNHLAAVGHRVQIGLDHPIFGEIVGIGDQSLRIIPESDVEGLRIGEEVRICGRLEIAPDNSWLGRIIDPAGCPLDGAPLFSGATARTINGAAPSPGQRKLLGPRLSTGSAVFDTLLPIVQGQRLGLFAGSGVGKSTLLGRLARGVHADVVVFALVGERGRELREFSENILGKDGLARSVIVAATSDRSALERRRCMLTAMSVAEHFRDQGKHVLFLADSVTRFAEAHREIALSAGEAPSLRGFPPSLQHAIMSLAERAGPGETGAGDITAIFSVLVAASDMDEPVADILRGVLDGHIVLDRKIAERGRFPAIDLLRSVSRSLPGAASEAENTLIRQARQIISAWEKSELMVQAGLYQKGSDPMIDLALLRWPGLDQFLSEPAPVGGNAASFDRLQQMLGR